MSIHGDDPGCVATSVRALKIRLNDKRWSSNASRASGLRRLGLAQLGSLGTIDDNDFVRRVVAMTIGTIVPRAMRNAADQTPRHAKALREAALLCETTPTLAAVRLAQKSAFASAEAYAPAAADVAYASAAVAANAATWAGAALAAARAANAAAWAAHAAAYAAAGAAGAAGAVDAELAFFAEQVVQILIDMNAPGCAWLDLAPLD